MSSKLLEVLDGTPSKVPPIWFMRQAGRHLPEYKRVRATTSNFIEFCFSPEKAAEVTLQPVDRYDMDAAILFADILLVPMALGRDVRFIKGQGPDLDPLMPDDVKSFDALKDISVLEPVYQTVKTVRRALDPSKALIGFCGGPWTVATYMIEGRGTPTKETAKRFAYEHPKAMEKLLDNLSDVSADYLMHQAQAGADVLKIFESWAEGLSPDQFDTLVIKPTRKIIEKVRAAGITKPIIGFPRGAGLNAVRYAHTVGIDAMAVGTDVHIPTIRPLLPDNLPLQGNLDPLALRIGGQTLEQAVQSVLDSLSGPHIFNLGHGVAPDVKIDNVHAVINHIRTGRGNYV